jgi:hypothetical protein
MSLLDEDKVRAAIDRVCRDDLSDYYGDVRQRMHDALKACVAPPAEIAPPQAGMCGNAGPGRNVLCQLRAGHLGWHEGKDYEALQPDVLGIPHIAHWGKAWTERGEQEQA